MSTVEILSQCVANEKQFRVIVPTPQTRLKIVKLLEEQCLLEDQFFSSKSNGLNGFLSEIPRKKFIIVEDTSLFSKDIPPAMLNINSTRPVNGKVIAPVKKLTQTTSELEKDVSNAPFTVLNTISANLLDAKPAEIEKDTGCPTLITITSKQIQDSNDASFSTLPLAPVTSSSVYNPYIAPPLSLFSVTTQNQALEKDLIKSFDLDKLLSSTMTGTAIKNIYKKQQKLESRFQMYLCDIIIGYFFKSPKTFRKLLNPDFKKLSLEIVKLFPNESALTYYTPPVFKQKTKDKKRSIVARGKLVDKYRNKIHFLRETAVFPGSRDKEEEEEDSSSTTY